MKRGSRDGKERGREGRYMRAAGNEKKICLLCACFYLFKRSLITCFKHAVFVLTVK